MVVWYTAGMENIYVYFAYFRREARKAKWSQERIDAVLDEAMSGDYSHALGTLLDAISKLQEEKEPIIF